MKLAAACALAIACHPADAPNLPPGVVYVSSVSGGMPGSGSSSISIKADGSSECTNAGPGDAPVRLVKGKLTEAQLESARAQLVACDACNTQPDDRTSIPDAPSMYTAFDMRGVSCGIDVLRRSWPEPRKEACSKAIRDLETAACTPVSP